MTKKSVLAVSLLLPFLAISSSGAALASHNYQHRPNNPPSASGYPAGYDTSGAPFYLSQLGRKPGLINGAPVNPCTWGAKAQNRC